MQILRVISSLNPVGGGPVEVIRQVVPVLNSLGHKIEIACLDPVFTEWSVQGAETTHWLGPALTGYAYSSELVSWLAKESQRFDCIVIDGIWQFHSLATVLATQRLNIPYFLYPHGMLDPWFRRTYPLKHLKKQLYWLLAESYVFRHANSIIFTCEQERLLARGSFWPYNCSEAIAPLGIAPPIGDPSMQKALFLSTFSHLADKRIILFLGRIHPKRAVTFLFKLLLMYLIMILIFIW
ncbi:MAG: glycosyltransferase [Synechococcaceae cyanobacterium SM2_3_1]|nr:glycosyltransferase [Synechococcaceae cyanobacterium SM2_3_1]